MTTSRAIKLSGFEREQLGKRAQLRRVQLGLKRPQIVDSIGISAAVLITWERCLPVKPKFEVEAAWEQQLHVPLGWLRDKQIHTPVIAPSSPIVEIDEAGTVAEEIRKIGAWLSRISLPKRTTDLRKLTMYEQRWADMFARRYGVAGENQATLQAIGERHGVTRERVRQIIQKMTERCRGISFHTPRTDCLAEAVRTLLPVSIDTLNATFREVLGEELCADSYGRFAREILGRNLLTLFEAPPGPARVVRMAIDQSTHDVELVRSVRSCALEMIRSCGAAHTMYVTGAVSAALGRAVMHSDVVQACQLVPGFDWLSEPDGWFWFGERHENRLVFVARKVLVAAGQRVDIEEIMAAFARARRRYQDANQQRSPAFEPPLPVAVAVLSRLSNVRCIQHDDFALIDPPPLCETLSDIELQFHDVCTAHGNVMSRRAAHDALVKHGSFGFMALQFVLAQSPIVRQIERGVFALRGVEFQLDALRVAKESVGGSNVLKVGFLAVDGCYRLTTRLSAYTARTRFWDIPVAMGRLLPEGQYDLAGFDEPVELKALGSGTYRLNRFVAKVLTMGVLPGSPIVLTVNPELRTIRVDRQEGEPDGMQAALDE